MTHVSDALGVLVLAVACGELSQAPHPSSPTRPVASVALAPSAPLPTSDVVAPPPTPAPKPEGAYALRGVSEGDDFKFHQLGDGTLLVSVGLSLGIISGATLRWDPELSDGLPRAWSPNVIAAIGSIKGESLEGAWLNLVSGCGTPPSDSGYPIEYEFVRKGGRWQMLPMAERRRWRGPTSYGIESSHVYAGKTYTLLRAANEARFVDGYVEDEELESISGCIGTSLLVDDQGKQVSSPALPKDLCVVAVQQADEGVQLAGWDRQHRLVIELRQGKSVTRRSPDLPQGCQFETDYPFRFSFVGFGQASFSGPPAARIAPSAKLWGSCSTDRGSSNSPASQNPPTPNPACPHRPQSSSPIPSGESRLPERGTTRRATV